MLSIKSETTSPALRVVLVTNVSLSTWAPATCPPVMRCKSSEVGVVGMIIEPSFPPGQLTWIISLLIM